MISFTTLAMGLSFLTNLALAYLVFRLHKKSKQKKPDATAQEVLAEILSGPSVVKIEVVERDSIIQWRGF
jgi:hypothetical protein